MSQDKILTNPASRLRIILNKVAKAKQGSSLFVWGEVFGILGVDNEAGVIDVTLQLNALRELFNETIFALREIPNLNEELFITPIKNLSRIFDWETHSKSYTRYLVNSFETYKPFLYEPDLRALDFAEDVIARSEQFSEKLIPENEIKEILDALSNLYDSINSSTLPIELKDSLLELVIEMRQSISEYNIRGAKALYRALTKSVGVIAVNKEAIEENKENPAIQDLINLIHRIEDANNTATNNKWTPLLSAASGILPSII
jgi:hypothetical protein